MAKRRERPVENPLSADLIAAAVQSVEPPPEAPPAKEPAQTSDGEKDEAPLPKKKPAQARQTAPKGRKGRAQEMLRVRFPAEEYAAMSEFTKGLRRLMGGSKVTESDITRALWSLAMRGEDTLTELKSKAPKVPRPANGDWIRKAEYDDAIARFLHQAIKRTSLDD